MPEHPDWFARLCLAAAGLLGAAGIAAAADASHSGDQAILGPLALVALTQAPAVVALSRTTRGRLPDVATALIAVGALVFSADLGLRQWLGASPIAISAPLSGTAMIVGWVLLIPAAFLARR